MVKGVALTTSCVDETDGPSGGIYASLDEAKAGFRAGVGCGRVKSGLGGSGRESLVATTSAETGTLSSQCEINCSATFDP
jgi:hypothetical protein